MKTTYIAFLRAINVGGHVVKMEKLRELFSELGFTNVRTYIQSGNVFFETSEADQAMLTRKIEEHVLKSLGYEVATFLRTIPELEHSLSLDPFKHLELTANKRFCIIFTSEPLPNDLALPFHTSKNDIEIIQITPGEAFVVLHEINGRTSNPGAFVEKTFKVKATARFFHTTVKILEAAKSNKQPFFMSLTDRLP